MLAMGADLQEAKQVCKERGDIFDNWLNSDECPIGRMTAFNLMSVYSELGGRSTSSVLFEHGFNVLASVTQTRDEDIRQALLEHIEQEAEDGNNG